MKFLGQRFQKLEHHEHNRETQTDATERITQPHVGKAVNAEKQSKHSLKIILEYDNYQLSM